MADCLLYYQSDTFVVVLSIVSAILVGLSGIFPLLIIPLEKMRRMSKTDWVTLNRWLSYAVGSLLGEVFIHLLPETWSGHYGSDEISVPKHRQFSNFCVIFGLLFFFFVEKLVNCEVEHKKIGGYFNLFLNLVDNFTHGVAIGASYVVSPRLGLVTTSCILIHEIPHEVGDFVILLRSGFTRWQAIKGQLTTASGSPIGAAMVIGLKRTLTGISTQWMLPFTAGGFLYIALVSLMPDLLKESSVKESIIHLVLIFSGLWTLLLLSTLFD